MSLKPQASWSQSLLTAGLLGACGAAWLGNVNDIVPDAYLDEVFHVRQAQVYCSGDFRTWDPKITTPPGLYIVSWLIYRITGRCEVADLRALNVITTIFGFMCVLFIYRSPKTSYGPGSPVSYSVRTLTAANIWLFPPLFFFTGLYYTDVQSAFWVLFSYYYSVRHQARHEKWLVRTVLIVLFGVVALSFRQTNIFWVAVFPAALTLVENAHKASRSSSKSVPAGTLSALISTSWDKSCFFDPHVGEARIEDYFKMCISLALVSLRQLQRNIVALIPYMTLMGLFAGFVIWNGGVVLGDKSNHVATIHTPQMLYVWPYMMFFSWPIIGQSFLQGHIATCKTWPQLLRKVLILGTTTLLAMVAVQYNTIIHPFTLADNRHYTFYVFRILMRHPAIKYLAAPVYILCGYATIQALGQKSLGNLEDKTATGSPQGCRTSFIVVWLATTTLSLITAPLVEPRYCILPWVMWRLHVPLQDTVTSGRGDSSRKQRSQQHRALYGVLLESLWFLAIAVGTGYMFLHRGFTWPQEADKVQRFMW